MRSPKRLANNYKPKRHPVKLEPFTQSPSYKNHFQMNGSPESPYLAQYREMGSTRGGNRRLDKDAVAKLKTWYLAHQRYPYPTEAEKQQLAYECGLQKKQINDWFINARRRIPIENNVVEFAPRPAQPIIKRSTSDGEVSPSYTLPKGYSAQSYTARYSETQNYPNSSSNSPEQGADVDDLAAYYVSVANGSSSTTPSTPSTTSSSPFMGNQWTPPPPTSSHLTFISPPLQSQSQTIVPNHAQRFPYPQSRPLQCYPPQPQQQYIPPREGFSSPLDYATVGYTPSEDGMYLAPNWGS